MWRRNTARLRDVPPSKVLYPSEVVYLTIVQPTNVKMLDSIISRIFDWQLVCKESLLRAIELGKTTDYIEPNDLNCPKVKQIIYKAKETESDNGKCNDENLVSEPMQVCEPTQITEQSNDKIDTTTDDNDDAMSFTCNVTLENDFCMDEEYTVYNNACTTSNDNECDEQPDFTIAVNFHENNDEMENVNISMPINIVNENEVTNRFSHITKFEEVTKFDLMNNWSELRKCIKDKNLLNRLNRKRAVIKKLKMNEERAKNGDAPLVFRRFGKWGGNN